LDLSDIVPVFISPMVFTILAEPMESIIRGTMELLGFDSAMKTALVYVRIKNLFTLRALWEE
jgi:hypothetical protein